MVGIYKISSPSGKVYIGQSLDIKKRWYYYTCPNSCKKHLVLERSFKKYGRDAHKFEVIHELPKDVEQIVLDTYEGLYMDLYKSAGISLLNSRGAGSHGKHSDEAKRKISEAHKKRSPMSEETRKKLSAARKGIPMSDHVRKKLQEARERMNGGYWKGKIIPPEAKEKMRLAKIGRKLSHETCRKVSESKKGKPAHNKGIPHSAAAKQNMSIAQTGKVLSEQHRRNISLVKAGIRMKQEAIDKMAASKRGKPSWNKGISPSVETRIKIGLAGLGRIPPNKGKSLADDDGVRRSAEAKKIKVIQYSLSGEYIKEWPSAKDARRQLGIIHIGCCCKGIRNNAGGFIWEYAAISA